MAMSVVAALTPSRRTGPVFRWFWAPPARSSETVGRGAARGSGLSITAMLIGVLSVLGYLTIYIVDGLVFGNTL